MSGALQKRVLAHVRTFIFAAVVAFGGTGWWPARGAEDLSPMVARIVAERHVPGLAVLVVKGNEIAARGVAGVRRAGHPEALSIDDSFLICSATKAMTATLVAMAVEEGKLSWTSTVQDVLGATMTGIRPEWEGATVAELLEHRAGAPADTAKIWTLLRAEFFSHGTAEEKRGMVIRSVLAHRPAYPPGKGYLYSTMDYLMVDAILEQVYGKSWEALIQDKLWTPLGIADAGFGEPKEGAWGHLGILMPGHAVKPGGLWARLTMPAGFDLAHMTMADWAKFVGMHLRGDRLLKAESFAALHAVSPKKFYEGGWFRAQLPWQADSTGVISSQGDNFAWHVEAWLVPSADTAVLIACNQGGPAADKPAAQAAKDVLLGLRARYLPGS